MVLATVTLATTLYATTILIVIVILPQMQGSLSATQDQITWVVTFNVLATAVVTPMTGWLAARFGRRNVMLYSIFGFTVTTFMSGAAGSLETLVLYRILQGGFGATLVPLGQATILDTYPQHQHGTATAVFGMGVVVGPVIGPTLGGYIAELYNWRWAFYLVAPIGVIAWLGIWAFLPDRSRESGVRLDWTGFIMLSASMICLQLLLDRGERQDWFESLEIIIEAAGAVLAFYMFVTHSLTTSRPFLNLKLLLNRNYSLGLIIVFIYGTLNFTPMVMMPSMLQDLMGYPDSIIGVLIAARGIGAMVGFFLAMFVARLDPRIGMTVGFGILALSGWHMMGFDLNTTQFDVWIASAAQGLAVGLLWVPLTVATFKTIRPADLPETSAVYHLLRNVGSSIFISLSVTTMIRTTRMNYADLAEFISPYNERLLFAPLSPSWNTESATGLAQISGEIARQAAMIGYINAFVLFTLASLAALPLVMLVRNPKSDRAAPKD
jgi:DHA2 family multidrug resistance protein